MLGKAPAVAVVDGQGHPFTFTECRRDRVGQSAAICLDGIDPIDDDEHVLARSHALLRAIVIEAQELAIDLRTNESCCPKLCGHFDVWPVRRSGQGERHQNR